MELEFKNKEKNTTGDDLKDYMTDTDEEMIWYLCLFLCFQ